MKLSVVVPLYNKEKSIAHTIDTILAQTHKDFELIIVDDGSTDQSAEIVSSIMDSRIQLLRKGNGGESSARNYGIAHAAYDYIAFIDADDEWMPHFLEEIDSLIRHYPEAALFATALMVKERNGEEYKLSYPDLPSDGSQCRMQNYFKSAFSYSPISSSSVCVKKTAFEDVGGFNEEVKNGPDLDLWCRLALRYPVAYSSRPSAVYRRDSENMVSRSTTTPCWFPFLRNYQPSDNKMIADAPSIERYILQRELEAASACLFVIKNRMLAREILKDIKYVHYNRWKYQAYRAIAILPQSLINVLYRIRSRHIKSYDS